MTFQGPRQLLRSFNPQVDAIPFDRRNRRLRNPGSRRQLVLANILKFTNDPYGLTPTRAAERRIADIGGLHQTGIADLGNPPLKSILEELRRRRVVRSTAYYLGAGWVLIGACDIFFPLMGISDSVFRAVIWAVVAGVPVVLVLSWSIQLRIRDSKADKADSRGLVDLAVMGLLAGALAVSVYINFAQIDIFDEPAGAPLVAVTPFEDLSDVGKAISFGLAEELQNLLVRVPGIRVMSPTASFEISRAGVDVLSAMGDLDADFIVRGSITGNGKSFRVIVRLIDVGTSEVTWSNVFEGELNDIFLAQRTVAGELAEALDVAIEYAFTTEAPSRLKPECLPYGR